jgi:RimJ/RimL family protein N-acetyltransferase
MQLWMGTEQRIEGFLAEKLGGRAPGFQWFGVLDDDGKEIGGATFTDYTDQDVTLVLAADLARHPKMARLIVPVLNYPFETWDVSHITAKIDEANAPCLRLVEWLGFKFMCRLRATSIRLYGLTKEDWAERREILFPT